MFKPKTILGYYSDLFFLVFMPIFSVLVAILMTRLASPQFVIFLTVCVTHAHLVIVFFRSHGNPEIFKSFRRRFLWIPPFLLFACYISNWVFILFSFLAVWWDSWHSGLQTFGIARIYDLRNGESAEKGRRLDFTLSLVLYLCPVLAGATFLDQMNNSFFQAIQFQPQYFSVLLNQITSFSNIIRTVVVFVSLFLLTMCVFEYRRLMKDGYQMHPFKFIILLSTGLATVFSWGLNHFGEAFLAMNLFHSVQYFALIWWSEKKNMISHVKFLPQNMKALFAFSILMIIGWGYGYWIASVYSHTVIRIAVVVALLHFWFDSFIWSVRSRQVI